MLIKAILTGGVLSALAGGIVYFGTEGAVATEGFNAPEIQSSDEVRLEDVELAGAPGAKSSKAASLPEIEVEEAEDTPVKTSKPKTKWLDQFLKKSMPTATPAPVTDVDVEVFEDEIVETPVVETPVVEEKKAKRPLSKKRKERNAVRDEATGRYIIADDGLNYGPDFEDEVELTIENKRPTLRGSENIERGVTKKADRKSQRLTWSSPKRSQSIDYDLVIKEAQKLLVVDMRNQAFLEIVDYAVDKGDMDQVADLIQYLSTPALRDTARARMGTELARQGNFEAAFSVLSLLEIDELSAPIRLEIITAMMATEQERKSFETRR